MLKTATLKTNYKTETTIYIENPVQDKKLMPMWTELIKHENDGLKLLYKL